MVFTSKIFEKHLWKSDILSKDGLSVSGTLVENESKIALKVGSLTFNRIKLEYLGDVKIPYNITKKIAKNVSCSFFSFHNFTIFFQTYTFSRILIFRLGFSVFQKSLLSEAFRSSKFSQ